MINHADDAIYIELNGQPYGDVEAWLYYENVMLHSFRKGRLH